MNTTGLEFDRRWNARIKLISRVVKSGKKPIRLDLSGQFGRRIEWRKKLQLNELGRLSAAGRPGLCAFASRRLQAIHLT